MTTDWLPLERMLGPDLCHLFMFMGRSGELYLYKHIGTRRYLNINRHGACFRHTNQGYLPTEREDAVKHVFG